MKFVLISIILLTSFACSWHKGPSEATIQTGKVAISQLPEIIVDDIKQLVAKSDWTFDCTNFTSIDYQAFQFSDDSYLMIVEAPDYLCTNSNTYIPVYYQGGELYGWGGPYPGRVSQVVKSEHGQWFLASYWAIEGTYPMLYQSADGIVWHEIKLPENRHSDCCFEQIDMLDITVDESNKEYLSIRFFNGNELDDFEWYSEIDDNSRLDEAVTWQKNSISYTRLYD